MSLKQEIETWVAALAAYDNNEFDEALKSFDGIADTSKILFNQGVIYATLGEHEKAVDCYQGAIRLDQYLAVAYFQQGVSNFLMGDFEEALANFNDTLLYLRGNNNIDYEQLGLKFKLYSCEVLFNRGLCYIYLQQKDVGMQDLVYAAKEKVVPDHDVIDEAISEQAEGYTVFSIPVGIVYRPNDAKVKNLKTKDYLGKARLVAASDRANAFTGFAGAEIKNASMGAKDDRPQESLSFAASNLVKPGLQSRSRQQSEPPMNRNMFPPTPPPESDRVPSRVAPMSRAQSVRNGGPKPSALDLSVAGFEGMRQDRRPAAARSASERPRPSRELSQRSNGSRAQRRAQEDEDEEYPDDVYDMYNGGGNGGGGRGERGSAGQRNRRGPRNDYIEEEDDYYDGQEPEFDMMPPRLLPKKLSRGTSRRGADIRKIRVKVHADDTRYVLIGTAIEFIDFVDQIRLKFGMRRSFKIKIKDDNDMITMADQDDLDMALSSALSNARRENSDMGKMEVWIQEM